MSDVTLIPETAKQMSTQLIKVVSTACDACMPKRRLSKRANPYFWWTEKIKSIRARCFVIVQNSATRAPTRDQKKQIEEF